MSKIDKSFKDLCERIMQQGVEYENKNRGVKRLQVPSHVLRHEFKDGFPILSLKRVPFKMVTGELIWFLRGDNDVKYLNENGITIWNKDAYNWYVKHHSHNRPDTTGLVENPDGSFRMKTFEEFEAEGTGSVGQNYSVQWRNFNGHTDQIVELIAGMEKDIMSSRLKVNAWNPSELDATALPPCHSEFQIIGVPLDYGQRRRLFLQNNPTGRCGVDKEENLRFFTEKGIPEFGFELHWNQRSVDVFLGLPFNIASYGLLAKILEEITGYPALAIEGTLKCVHFYDNQYDAAANLVAIDPDKHANCELTIPGNGFLDAPDLHTLFECMQIEGFRLEGYTAEAAEKVEMLAPKEL